ncbi:MAG: Crp/Fnr family transcriptional regulator [Bacteroidetes bacterium]|nr:Crp/Fnr family transcriptional regulator [Bacteroidota bacterium]MBL6962919.1 Crp/Fnr family transcriptional regulator [Bacteroidota bacterium]
MDTYTNNDIVSCHHCANKDASLFTHISNQHKEIINNAKVHCDYKKGETIFKEGMKPTGLICLNEGKVKIFKEGIGGKEQILRFAKPIQLIGFRAVFSDENYMASAVAIEDSRVCHIEKDKVLEVVDKDSELAFKIIRRLADELGDAKTRLVNLTQKHVRGRLSEALIILHDTYGSNSVDGYLDVLIGRNDLADLANMTTSNASRTLSAFVEEGLLSTQGRKIKILNMEKIKQISSYG